MRKKTFTKSMIKAIICVALVDMQFPFILALMDRPNIAETLGGIIATEIVGVVLVYCLKSFFETREEEKNKIEQEKLNTKDAEG